MRLLVGVSLHLGLPLYGHADEDDQAGYVFTDAHIRDDQAWKLASSDRPILDAFSRKFSSDQYGGLLAFSAFVYRYLSPDAQRPLLLILLSALVAALGVPFLWMGTRQVFGEKVAYAAAWIFALYPESILLGSSAMREPYLLTFSAMAFYGFVYGVSELAGEGGSIRFGHELAESKTAPRIWLALGLLGMLLVSPAIALAHLIIFAGWVFFTDENRSLSWKPILVFALIFGVGLLALSASLNRSGQFDDASPLRVVNDWLRLAVKWDAYQLERSSGWVQKLFDGMPEWMRLPFVAVYGVLQPVLPAAVFEPDNSLWQVIYLVRAAGWYLLLPMLILSFGAAAGQGVEAEAERHPVALASRVDLDPALRPARRRRLVGQSALPDDPVRLGGGAGGRRLGLVAGDAQCVVRACPDVRGGLPAGVHAVVCQPLFPLGRSTAVPGHDRADRGFMGDHPGAGVAAG